MTEQEWRTSGEPEGMLAYLRSTRQLSKRTARLYAVSCCRLAWRILTDERSRIAVEVAEHSADHDVSERELDAASAAAEEAFEDGITDYDDAVLEDNPGVTSLQYSAACSAASYASNPELRDEDIRVVVIAVGDAIEDKGKLANLIRDVIAFTPVMLDASWLTWNSGAIPRAAAAAYQERALPSGHLDNTRLAVLADMLEEAGCRDEEVLGHLRADAVHVRGCFALDLLLGKE